jgi:hypothetical protein
VIETDLCRSRHRRTAAPAAQGRHGAQPVGRVLSRRQQRTKKVTRMPRRTDIYSILIVGAGPIVIGQACEFDYSGVQAYCPPGRL